MLCVLYMGFILIVPQDRYMFRCTDLETKNKTIRLSNQYIDGSMWQIKAGNRQIYALIWQPR